MPIPTQMLPILSANAGRIAERHLGPVTYSTQRKINGISPGDRNPALQDQSIKQLFGFFQLSSIPQ